MAGENGETRSSHWQSTRLTLSPSMRYGFGFQLGLGDWDKVFGELTIMTFSYEVACISAMNDLYRFIFRCTIVPNLEIERKN